MSMLTLQCQKLRNKANDLRERFTFTRYGGAVSRDSLAYEAASLMEDAADTIADLRMRLTETCHDTNESPLRFVCSECGGVTSETAPRYCPLCGRRVVE